MATSPADLGAPVHGVAHRAELDGVAPQTSTQDKAVPADFHGSTAPAATNDAQWTGSTGLTDKELRERWTDKWADRDERGDWKEAYADTVGISRHREL